jgi:hypothetical protein
MLLHVDMIANTIESGTTPLFRCVFTKSRTMTSLSTKECSSLPLKPGVVMAYNQNRITPTDKVKKGAQVAWKVACGRFAYYLVLPDIKRRYY